MSSFLLRNGAQAYESTELLEEPSASFASRSVYHSAITEAPVLNEIGWAEDWDGPQRSSSLHEAISEPMWYALLSDVATLVALPVGTRERIRRGSTIAELIQTSPEEVISALKTHAVKKLGTFKMKVTYRAFETAFTSRYCGEGLGCPPGLQKQDYAHSWFGACAGDHVSTKVGRCYLQRNL